MDEVRVKLTISLRQDGSIEVEQFVDDGVVAGTVLKLGMLEAAKQAFIQDYEAA